MKIYNSLFLISLSFFLSACGSDSEDTDSSYSLEISENKKEFQLGETIKAQVNGERDSVVYYLGEQRLQKIIGNEQLNYTFQNEKLGKWVFTAKIFRGGKLVEKSQEISLFNDTAPATYTYEIVNSYPHATDAYTQGLEFYEGELYESTGQYGSSSLRKVDLQTGEILKKIDVSSKYFAEGMTILNDKIYQLTWKEGVGFIYDVESFEKLGEFAYDQSKEGWGLTNDGNRFYKSDGTERIWFLNTETQAEEGFIQVATNQKTYSKMNELEWVEGKIYANTYQKDGVAIINSANGAIEGVIDFTGLRDNLGNQEDLDPLNDVLNGIAYNKDTKQLYVTGKDWDTLFEVKIIKK